MKAPAIASEYYTVAEVETFKKPKKKRRKMKVKSILDELTPEVDTGRDHGQRWVLYEVVCFSVLTKFLLIYLSLQEIFHVYSLPLERVWESGE